MNKYDILNRKPSNISWLASISMCHAWYFDKHRRKVEVKMQSAGKKYHPNARLCSMNTTDWKDKDISLFLDEITVITNK